MPCRVGCTDVRGTWNLVPGLAFIPRGAIETLDGIDATPNAVPRSKNGVIGDALSMAPFGLSASQGTRVRVPRTYVVLPGTFVRMFAQAS